MQFIVAALPSCRWSSRASCLRCYISCYTRRLYSRRRGYRRSVASVCSFVCLSVCPRSKRKRLELSTPNLVHIYSIAVARYALTQRSKGQRSRSHIYENRHSRTVASDACCYGRVLLPPAWVCMSIRLPMFSSCI